MPDTINFYRLSDPHGYLSNFWPAPVAIDGELWPTTEHYFQAAKHPDRPYLQEAILGAKTPAEAKRLAWSQPARADWQQVRDGIMRRALWFKFTQHHDLGRRLRDTGGARLVEHTSNDRYWGDGGDGTGANRLGQLLEDVRGELGAG